MHAEVRYLLEMLGAFVRQDSAPPLPADIHTDTLLRLAQNANLAGAVGYMLLPQADALGDAAADCHKLFFKTVGLFANRHEACSRLSEQLTEASIRHAFVKGAALSGLYPAKELRTFGDVDVFVPSQDLAALKELLAKTGDTITHEDATQICISRPPLFVEFHFSLVPDGENAYLAAAHEHMHYDSTLGLHTVSPLFHFVYLLAHQRHHFAEDSPGIRSYLDLAVLAKSGLLPDKETLEAALQTADLLDYAKTALSLCERWFSVPSPLDPVSLDDADVAFLEEYLFSAGQFAVHQNPRKKQVAAQGGKAPRFRAFWRSLFPPAAHMRTEATYAAVAKRCLPLAYIYRLIRGGFRPKYALQSAKHIAGASEDAAAHIRINHIVGGLTHEKR